MLALIIKSLPLLDVPARPQELCKQTPLLIVLVTLQMDITQLLPLHLQFVVKDIWFSIILQMAVFVPNSQLLMPQELVFVILATILQLLLLRLLLVQLVLISKWLTLKEMLANVLLEPQLPLVIVLALYQDILNNLQLVAHYWFVVIISWFLIQLLMDVLAHQIQLKIQMQETVCVILDIIQFKLLHLYVVISQELWSTMHVLVL